VSRMTELFTSVDDKMPPRLERVIAMEGKCFYTAILTTDGEWYGCNHNQEREIIKRVNPTHWKEIQLP